MVEDHYKALGLTRFATQADIKKAYRSLALQLHPDKNPNGGAAIEHKFKAMSSAYAILSDPSTKVAYDSQLFKQNQATMNPYGTGRSYSTAAPRPKTAGAATNAFRQQRNKYGPNVSSTGKRYDENHPTTGSNKKEPEVPKSSTANRYTGAFGTSAAPSEKAAPSPPKRSNSAFGDTEDRIRAAREAAKNLPRTPSASGYSFTAQERDEMDAMKRRHESAQSFDTKKWEDIQKRHSSSGSSNLHSQQHGAPPPPKRGQEPSSKRPQSAYVPKHSTPAPFISEDTVSSVLESLRKAREQCETPDPSSARRAFDEVKAAAAAASAPYNEKSENEKSSTLPQAKQPAAASTPRHNGGNQENESSFIIADDDNSSFTNSDAELPSTPPPQNKVDTTLPTPPTSPPSKASFTAAYRRNNNGNKTANVRPASARPLKHDSTSDLFARNVGTSSTSTNRRRPPTAGASRTQPPKPASMSSATPTPQYQEECRQQPEPEEREPTQSTAHASPETVAAKSTKSSVLSVPDDKDIAEMSPDQLRELVALLEYKTKVARQSLLLTSLNKK